MSQLIDPSTTLLDVSIPPAFVSPLVPRAFGALTPRQAGQAAVVPQPADLAVGDRQYAVGVIKGSGIIPVPAGGGWEFMVGGNPAVISSTRFALFQRWVPDAPTGFPANPTDGAGASATAAQAYTMSTFAFGGVDPVTPEATVTQVATHASARFRWMGGRPSTNAGGDIAPVPGCIAVCVFMHNASSRTLTDLSASAAYGKTMWNTRLEDRHANSDSAGPQIRVAYEFLREAGPIGQRPITYNLAAVSLLAQWIVKPLISTGA